MYVYMHMFAECELKALRIGNSEKKTAFSKQKKKTKKTKKLKEVEFFEVFHIAYIKYPNVYCCFQ